jgi:DNA polymerase-1
MRLVAVDTETHLIRPGLAVPRLVCVQIGESPDPLVACPAGEAERAAWRRDLWARSTATLHLAAEGIPRVRALLQAADVRIVGQNIAFDLAVLCRASPDLLPLVFQAYSDGRIEDIRLREKLILLAEGRLADDGESGGRLQAKFDLAATVQRHFGADIADDKHNPNSWRLRYRELEATPVAAWPTEAVRYALDDVRWTLAVWFSQRAYAEGEREIPDSLEQAKHAWWMHLMGSWGVRTDLRAVDALRGELEAELARMDSVCRAAGLLRESRKRDGSIARSQDRKALQALVTAEYDGDPPMTAGRVRDGERVPDVSTAKEVLVARIDGAVMDRYDERIAAGVPVAEARRGAALEARVSEGRIDRWAALRAVADRAHTEKILSTYVPALQDGTTRAITPRWNSLVASGRVSCIEPNLTNLPRKGGVRACYVPRPGWWYCIADYSFIELVTLAQTCLDWYGESAMAAAINAGLDPHLDMAASLLGIDYAEAKARKNDPEVANMRQAAKAYNFGFPGGLGPAKMVDYARVAYGVGMSLDEARQRREDWYRKWPEMRRYHADVGRLTERGEAAIVQPVSQRIRGGCNFTAAANSYFQGRTADGAKRAGWRLAQACYLPNDGPLYGCRTVAFVHDEFIVEAPAAIAPEAAERLAEIMVAGMAEVVPDVKISVEAVLCDRWHKGAKPVRDAAGRLTVWKPKETP